MTNPDAIWTRGVGVPDRISAGRKADRSRLTVGAWTTWATPEDAGRRSRLDESLFAKAEESNLQNARKATDRRRPCAFGDAGGLIGDGAGDRRRGGKRA